MSYGTDISENIEVIAIGASAGGPDALQRLLAELPEDFEPPILIVQHVSPGFIHSMAEWLCRTTGKQVHVAMDGEQILPGRVYLAPDGFHMGVGHGRRITLRNEGLENGLRPAVSHLFRSVDMLFRRKAVGIMLSGMGKDGAEELRRMKERGAVTIVQDMESSAVYGMPKAAIKLDAAAYVLPPEKIALLLKSLANGRRAENSAPVSEKAVF